MIYCKETYATQTTTVEPKDLNVHHTLFGGALFSLIDITSAISVTRYCHARTFTVAINQMEYYKPLALGQIVTVESFVCGHGKRSIETFAIVYGENLDGSRFLAASCFLTYALAKDEKTILPELVCETNFEKKIHETYNKRKELNLKYHQHLQEILVDKDK